jgi:Protein of unknown function (DUF3562)
MGPAPSQAANAVDLSTEHSRVIASLAQKMRVPVEKIEQIYSDEFSKLSAEARIRGFVGVLAIRRTRAILQESKDS